MAKQNNTLTIVGILVVIAVIILVVKPEWLTFMITGNERIVRQSYPSLVDPGSSFQVTYEVTGASGTWGASVVDSLSCKDSSGTIYLREGMSQKFVMLSDSGTVAVKTFNVPNVMGLLCTFTGDYQFGNKSIISFPTQTMQTRGKQCASGADTNSDGVVSIAELRVYGDGWIAGTKTRDALGKAIMDWANGC